jgi:hypothetical protein
MMSATARLPKRGGGDIGARYCSRWAYRDWEFQSNSEVFLKFSGPLGSKVPLVQQKPFRGVVAHPEFAELPVETLLSSRSSS